MESGEEREYFRADGVVSIVVDPTGQRLAVVHRSRQGDDGVILTAAQQTAPTGLFVVDLESGEVTPVDDHPLRISPFWSPDGELLLSLTVDDDDPRGWARWEVHDLAGDLVTRTERMQPSRTVAQLLPFADQYAQSSTPWAPDGGAFLFAGTVEGGTEDPGIYVHDTASAAASERVGDGTYAVWSPR